MLSVDPKKVTVSEFHSYLLGAIAPRPIALASTIDTEGNVNLSPFSFFNAFSANPPVLVFSPARRARDNTTKHTLDNVKEVPEVVINTVSFDMVEQTSLSSTEYPKGVNEFIKAGFTEIPSEKVKPPRVAESPATFECKVTEIIPLGHEGGAGQLVVCEVLLVHINREIIGENEKIDPLKTDFAARMGGDYYCRAHGDNVFKINKPNQNIGIGIDQFPDYIKSSTLLTGNELGKLGNIETLPKESEIRQFMNTENIQEIIRQSNDTDQLSGILQEKARKLLINNNITDAWKVLLIEKYL